MTPKSSRYAPPPASCRELVAEVRFGGIVPVEQSHVPPIVHHPILPLLLPSTVPEIPIRIFPHVPRSRIIERTTSYLRSRERIVTLAQRAYPIDERVRHDRHRGREGEASREHLRAGEVRAAVAAAARGWWGRRTRRRGRRWGGVVFRQMTTELARDLGWNFARHYFFVGGALSLFFFLPGREGDGDGREEGGGRDNNGEVDLCAFCELCDEVAVVCQINDRAVVPSWTTTTMAVGGAASAGCPSKIRRR